MSYGLDACQCRIGDVKIMCRMIVPIHLIFAIDF